MSITYLRGSERTQAQEERTRSPHRDACRDQVEGLNSIRLTMEKQLVDPDRPPSSSRAEEECGNTRNTQMGPVPRWGLVFLQRGVRLHPRGFITAPFIRLTLMSMTQSLVNTYSCVKRVFHSCHGEPSEDKILILILVVVLTTLSS